MSIRYTGTAPLTEVLRDPRYIGQEGMRNSAADEIDRLHAELRWVSEQRWSEDADLDDICTRADRALKQPSTGTEL